MSDQNSTLIAEIDALSLKKTHGQIFGLLFISEVNRLLGHAPFEVFSFLCYAGF